MEFTQSSVAVPEGDAPTRARVVRTILEQGPSTAAQLADLLGSEFGIDVPDRDAFVATAVAKGIVPETR